MHRPTIPAPSPNRRPWNEASPTPLAKRQRTTPLAASRRNSAHVENGTSACSFDAIAIMASVTPRLDPAASAICVEGVRFLPCHGDVGQRGILVAPRAVRGCAGRRRTGCFERAAVGARKRVFRGPVIVERRQQLDEARDDRRIERLARFLPECRHGFGDAHRLLRWAIRREVGEAVDHREDARAERDRRRPSARPGIRCRPSARGGCEPARPPDRGTARCPMISAPISGVHAQLGQLFLSERSGLGEHLIRDREVAYVVEQHGRAHALDFVRREAQRLGERAGHPPLTAQLRRRRLRPRVDRESERLDRWPTAAPRPARVRADAAVRAGGFATGAGTRGTASRPRRPAVSTECRAPGARRSRRRSPRPCRRPARRPSEPVRSRSDAFGARPAAARSPGAAAL